METGCAILIGGRSEGVAASGDENPVVIPAKTGVTSLGNLDYDYDYDNDNDNDNDCPQHCEERDLDDNRPCYRGFTPMHES
ncbi:hypothetical protein [Desulfatirhabdium butyrativorans]|uniref:hypothetical protein n=1 Tax=Desulfatirhabdium butyrativorans TaxID=340467 RepID=UPI000423D7FA|nr:hypothetical protein [Desulfatirhabdium butyrativorans]